jgi:hypothetical protein
LWCEALLVLGGGGVAARERERSIPTGYGGVGGLTGSGDAGPEASALRPQFTPGLSESAGPTAAIAFDFFIQTVHGGCDRAADAKRSGLQSTV